jgi:hypothetical protein
MTFKQILILSLATISVCFPSASKQPSKSSLAVGILFVNATAQHLDTGPADLIAMMGKKYIGLFHTPKLLADQAVDLNLLWISEDGQPIETTSGAKISMTVGIIFR